MKGSILPIFIPHLGCPHQCVFCNQRHISWERQPEPEELPALIEAGLPHADRPQIAFYGGSFTAIERSLMTEYLQAAYPYVEDGRADSIRVSTRPDAVDDEIMAILHRYGVRPVELGGQSMDDEGLGRSGRGHAAFDTARAAAMLRDAGFEVILQMMPGLPGSSAGTGRMAAHASVAQGQRSRSTQPPSASLISPRSIVRSRSRRVSSATGEASSSALVYGWAGWSNSSSDAPYSTTPPMYITAMRWLT